MGIFSAAGLILIKPYQTGRTNRRRVQLKARLKGFYGVHLVQHRHDHCVYKCPLIYFTAMKKFSFERLAKLPIFSGFLNFAKALIRFWYQLLGSSRFSHWDIFSRSDIEKMSGKKSELSFELDGRVFSQPRLLGETAAKALSKADRLGWVVLMEGQPVKIYECYDESQAAFIEKVSNHTALKDFFPSCLMRKGVYLIVEWVQGKLITWKQVQRDEKILYQFAQIQSLIHVQSLKTTISSGFSYMDYLKRRLQRFKGIFPMNEAIKKIFSILDNNTFIAQKRISHPDLTANNMILENDTGNLKVVDNELLTENSYYLIDLFNTCYSFGQEIEGELLERYLAHYVESGGDLSLIAEHEQFFLALWYLRVIGSSLQSGAIEEAFRLSQEYLENNYKLHPLVQLVGEKFV